MYGCPTYLLPSLKTNRLSVGRSGEIAGHYAERMDRSCDAAWPRSLLDIVTFLVYCNVWLFDIL